jgi:hypothetical protein
MAGALVMPTTIGAERVINPATVKATFFGRFRVLGTCPARIVWKRFLRLDPLTPETHNNGDSKYVL